MNQRNDSRNVHSVKMVQPEPGRRSDLQGLFATARAIHDCAVRDRLAAPDHRGPTEATEGRGLACAVVTGDPAAFSTAHDPFLDIVDLPAPANGWRSLTDICNGLGKRISLELVSRIAVPGAEAAVATGAHRAEALLKIGEADRRLAASKGEAPASELTLGEDLVYAGGCLDLLLLSAVLDEVEADVAGSSVQRVRRMHAFPGMAPSGPYALVIQLWSGPQGRFSTSCIRSHLCASGGTEIVAVCETLYRP